MALGLGEGAEANASLAIAVIGGLTVSTFLTLIFVPTLYYIVERWRLRRKEIREAAIPATELKIIPDLISKGE
jgi:predicted RND superfamily exporter protein